jgi:hypothetical protein
MATLSSLDTTSVPLLGAAALVVWYVVTAFYSWYRLRHVPGPTLASFSYLWVAKNTLLGRSAIELKGLKKYGSLVRISPNYLVTDDADLLRKISSARSRYGRDQWFEGFKFDEHDNMGSISDVAAHDRVRAKVASGYCGRDNVDIEGGVDSQIAHLIALIRRKHLSAGDQTNPVDFAFIARYFTLDVITRVGYGKPFGFLDGGDLYGYLRSTDRFLVILSLALDMPALRNMFQSPLLKRFAPKTTDEQGFGKIIG